MSVVIEHSSSIRTLEELENSPKAVLTQVEAGAVLGVDRRTVSAGIKAGNIPAIQIGRRVVIPREPFLRMLKTGIPANTEQKEPVA